MEAIRATRAEREQVQLRQRAEEVVERVKVPAVEPVEPPHAVVRRVDAPEERDLVAQPVPPVVAQLSDQQGEDELERQRQRRGPGRSDSDRELLLEIGCEELRYDCIGVGEGVKSAFKVTERILPFKTIAWNAGDAASECIYSDGRKGNEKFLNARAEAWWAVRERFRKVYERVTLGTVYPDDECISIPNNSELIAELSMPLVQTTETGKIKIESKKDMAKRGIKSPDRADGLIMAFAPMTPAREFWFA